MEKIDLVLQLLNSNQAESLRRFDKIDRRFVGIEHRLDRIDGRLDRVEGEMGVEKEKLQAVYDAREKVKIEFGWQWSLVSLTLVVFGVSFSRLLPF